MTQFEAMPNAERILHYSHGAAEAPYIWRISLDTYPNRHAGCHWHEEMEFIYIESGRMNFFVSGEKMLLGQGDCLFINAGQLHYGYSVKEQPCQYICLLFHPDVLSDRSAVKRDYLNPLRQDGQFAFLQALAETPLGQRIGSALGRIWDAHESGAFGSPLDILGQLLSLLTLIVGEREKHSPHFLPNADCLPVQKRMLSFIAEHYAENITVDQIAQSAGLDKKKGNDLFLRFLGQTAQKYLTAYRLEASGGLLVHTDKSIAEVGALSGFRHASYYGKLFEQAYGCTPSDYRKKMRG